MGLFHSYDKEYEELFSHLTEHHDWEMKRRYAKAYLDAYKKPLAKKLREGRKAASDILIKGPGFESVFGQFYPIVQSYWNQSILVWIDTYRK